MSEIQRRPTTPTKVGYTQPTVAPTEVTKTEGTPTISEREKLTTTAYTDKSGVAKKDPVQDDQRIPGGGDKLERPDRSRLAGLDLATPLGKSRPSSTMAPLPGLKGSYDDGLLLTLRRQEVHAQASLEQTHEFVKNLPPEATKTFHAAQAQNIHGCVQRESLDLISGKDQGFAKALGEKLGVVEDANKKFAGVFNAFQFGPQQVQDLSKLEAPPDHVDKKYKLLTVLTDLNTIGSRSSVTDDVANVLKDKTLTTFEARLGKLTELRDQKVATSGPPHPLNLPFKATESDLKAMGDTIKSIAWIANRAGVAATAGDLWKAVQGQPSLKAAFTELDRLMVGTSAKVFDTKVAFPGHKDLRAAVQDATSATELQKLGLTNTSNLVQQLKSGNEVVRVSSTELFKPASTVTKGPVHQELTELEGRLKNTKDEQSLIGGRDYAKARYPEDVLNKVLEGKIKVMVFDGPAAEGLDYVQKKMIPSENGSHAVTKLQGLDGSGTRALVTAPSGEQVLLVTGFGTSRQVHNAGAFLTYNDDGKPPKHIPLSNVTLAKSDAYDTQKEFQKGIGKAIANAPAQLTKLFTPENAQKLTGEEQKLKESAKKFFGTDDLGLVQGNVKAAQDAPTVLCMHFVPNQLADLKDNVLFLPNQANIDGIPVNVALYKQQDGRVTQVLMPKAGGSAGLYGETAGDFTKAFFAVLGEKANPNVLFNGTAGGFQGTDGSVHKLPEGKKGFPEDFKPGGRMTPTGSFVDPKGGPSLPVDSLITRNPKLLGEFAITENSDHTAVMAPAVETSGQIQGLVNKGVSSVDVEALPIRRAVEDLNKGRPEARKATFTPVYTHSDDPMHCLHDKDASLARMGPFFEGGGTDMKLQGAMGRLIEEASKLPNILDASPVSMGDAQKKIGDGMNELVAAGGDTGKTAAAIRKVAEGVLGFGKALDAVKLDPSALTNLVSSLETRKPGTRDAILEMLRPYANDSPALKSLIGS